MCERTIWFEITGYFGISGVIGVFMLATGKARADPLDKIWEGPGPGPGMMGWGGWFLGPVMMILALAVVVGVILLLVRLFRGTSSTNPDQTSDRSVAILRERFAKGEIDADEFEARRKLLDK